MTRAMAATRTGAGHTAHCMSRAVRAQNPLTRAFVEAGQQAGYQVTADYKW